MCIYRCRTSNSVTFTSNNKVLPWEKSVLPKRKKILYDAIGVNIGFVQLTNISRHIIINNLCSKKLRLHKSHLLRPVKGRKESEKMISIKFEKLF